LKKGKVFVCGGDKRSIYIAKYFGLEGYSVKTYGLGIGNESLDELKDSNMLVLGLPSVKDGKINMPLSNEVVTLKELVGYCSPDTVVAGGRLTKDDIEIIESQGLLARDYSEDEIFQVENALYTAEGTVCSLIENTEKSLCGMKILILGGGRISKALSSLLANAPCKICVYARSELGRTFFNMRGIETTKTPNCLCGYDVVINTVPADILPYDTLKNASKDSLIIDLSARPGYVNKEICKELGLKLMYLPGIPLTSAPCSAGVSAAKAAERILG